MIQGHDVACLSRGNGNPFLPRSPDISLHGYNRPFLIKGESFDPSGWAMVGYEFTPRTSSAFGLIGNKVPW